MLVECLLNVARSPPVTPNLPRLSVSASFCSCSLLAAVIMSVTNSCLRRRIRAVAWICIISHVSCWLPIPTDICGHGWFVHVRLSSNQAPSTISPLRSTSSSVFLSSSFLPIFLPFTVFALLVLSLRGRNTGIFVICMDFNKYGSAFSISRFLFCYVTCVCTLYDDVGSSI